ncbi:MAG: glycosyltransferase family 2 protein [Rikenellaceae bacterium]
MKISIITSCLNRSATIRQAIESVLSQDYLEIEYIVIDGASKDNSLNIINEYRGKITTIISESDRGMYEAINKGIALATGDVIGLLNSDDIFYSVDTISNIAKRMVEVGADIVYGNGLFVNSNDSLKIVRNWISGEYNRDKIRNGWLPLHTTVFIRRSCFDKLGLYDENYKIAADSDLLVRYLYYGDFKIAYLNEYVVKMRMGGISTNLTNVKQKFIEDRRLYKTHGFNSLRTILCKMLSKVPQFISAKFLMSQ